MTIGDMYTSGELNLWEAKVALSCYMTEDEAIDLLKSLDRNNVVQFPVPRSEDEEELTEDWLTEEDEACSKAVFTFTADFELDDPA